MKKFRQKMAEKAGFTLVELIVVIAILGILAAVAVPAYSGYVVKAKKAADLQTLDAVKTAVTVIAAEAGDDVYKIEVTNNTGASKYYKSSTDSAGTEVSAAEVKALTGTLSFSGDFASATWTAGSEWNVTTS